jgi:hypothetical protein
MGTKRDDTKFVDLQDPRLQQLMRESLDNAAELALMMCHGANLDGCEIVGIFSPEQAEATTFAEGSAVKEEDNVIPYPQRPSRLNSGQT